MTTTTAQHTSGFSAILSENKNQMTSIERYRDAPVSTMKRNALFAGTCLGGFFLIGLIGAQVITGVVATGVAVVGGLGLWYGARMVRMFDPAIMQKAKNTKVNMMIKEARQNAVAQLSNQVLENEQRLAAAREARNKVRGQIRKLEGKVDPANKGKPAYEKKMAMLETVKKAEAQMSANIDKAAIENRKFETKVQEYKELDSFAEEFGAAMSALSAAGDDKLNEMLSLESFDAIDTNFNEAIVSIESAAHDGYIDNMDLDDDAVAA